MINEKLMVEQLLAGKKINIYQMRSVCSLLARHFLLLGFNEVETRNKIFEWATSNKYYVKVGLKRIVTDVADDLQVLRDVTPVYINSADIAFIKACGHTKLEKKLALAILCYAKIYADSDGVMELPISSICDWIGQPDPKNAYNRLLPTLLEKGFFTNEEDINKWNGRVVTKRTRTMRINHELVNRGKLCLENNDINKLFDEIKWK